VLGPGSEVLGVARQDADDGVHLVLRYRLADRVAESAVDGETVVAARAKLREALVLDRIGLGFRVLADRP
jgi:hypothetical protein